MIALGEGGVIAGRYRLERELARGGMGAVWVARHLQLDVPVAIKFMDPVYAASSDARARFEREAKAAAKLQSPNVVQVHDYGVESEMPFIVMELLQGEDLGTRLKRDLRLSLTATATILSQIAKALRSAHEGGIVHRDLKPGNIFLSRHHEEEVVKVLDFGIAKATDASKVGESTKTGTLIGSPHYMSPEQARGSKQLDYRSDLWSLGVIAFRSLTGQLPFPGEEIGEVIMAICADPIPVPSQIAPNLDGEVDRFFERALARDVSKRFQSARELADAFIVVAEGSDGTPINRVTRPPPPDRSLAAMSLEAGRSAVTGSEQSSAESATVTVASFVSEPVVPPEELETSALMPRLPIELPASSTLASAAEIVAPPSPSPAQAVESGAIINGTLAPTGNSLATAPKRGARPTVIVAVALGVIAAIATMLMLRSSAPPVATVDAQKTAAPVPSAVSPAVPPPSSETAAVPAASAPDPAPAVSASAPPDGGGAALPKPPVGKAVTPAVTAKPAEKNNSLLGF